MSRVKTANYKLQGEYDFNGLDIAVENKKGTKRYWYDEHGKEKGSTHMYLDYGYIRLTKGTDGDHVDCYVGPKKDAKKVFLVNQMCKPPGEIKKDGKAWTTFDEQKCMLGFDSAADAKAAYLKQYNDPRFFGTMTEMSFEDFKAKVLDKANHGKKIAKLLHTPQGGVYGGAAADSQVELPKEACGDMLQYFADHPEKLKEKKMRDKIKTAVSAGWIREHAVSGLAKRNVVLGGKEQASIARKAVDYARAKELGEGVVEAGAGLKDVLKSYKDRAATTGRRAGSSSAGWTPHRGPPTAAEEANAKAYDAYRHGGRYSGGGGGGRFGQATQGQILAGLGLTVAGSLGSAVVQHGPGKDLEKLTRAANRAEKGKEINHDRLPKQESDFKTNLRGVALPATMAAAIGGYGSLHGAGIGPYGHLIGGGLGALAGGITGRYAHNQLQGRLSHQRDRIENAQPKEASASVNQRLFHAIDHARVPIKTMPGHVRPDAAAFYAPEFIRPLVDHVKRQVSDMHPNDVTDHLKGFISTEPGAIHMPGGRTLSGSPEVLAHEFGHAVAERKNPNVAKAEAAGKVLFGTKTMAPVAGFAAGAATGDESSKTREIATPLATMGGVAAPLVSGEGQAWYYGTKPLRDAGGNTAEYHIRNADNMIGQVAPVALGGALGYGAGRASRAVVDRVRKHMKEKKAALSPAMLSGLQHGAVGAGIGAVAGGVGGMAHAAPGHRAEGFGRGALVGAGLGAAGGAGVAALKNHGAQQLATLQSAAGKAHMDATAAHAVAGKTVVDPALAGTHRAVAGTGAGTIANKAGGGRPVGGGGLHLDTQQKAVMSPAAWGHSPPTTAQSFVPHDVAQAQAASAGGRAEALRRAAETLGQQQQVMNKGINRAALVGAGAGTGLMGYMAVPRQYGGVGTASKQASDGREGRIADRLDDVGIATLASPYLADAAAGGLKRLMLRGGRVGALAAEGHGIAEAVAHKLHNNPAVELGGLALVAPGVTHGLAKGINKLTGPKPVAAPPQISPEVLKTAEEIGRSLANNERVIKLSGMGRLALGLGAVGLAGGTVLAGKKAIDTTHRMATHHAEPAQYVGVPAGMRPPVPAGI